MEAKQWIYQIIAFLILAAIIDLLIPSTRLQKYVRLAIGMTMMLLFLKPVFHLFGTDVERLLERGVSPLFADKQETQIKNQVEMQKSEILGVRQAYISKQMAVQLKEQINPVLKERHQAEISNLELKVSDQAGEIEKAEAVLKQAEEEDAVAKVDTVIIGSPAKAEQKIPKKEEDAIRDILQKEWNLDKQQLTLLWEGGTTR
ncbi:stage III sporulation protein AF [Aciduricibacillus chroicocephali]|uniref:Stage III sporulation protein AF n=1 Tax=Aciduricibacillus chroicocephali TaxID=3054939 RepID=A0ABY9KRU1_9BACI|nr:stage III sporulation protein AF [Bacillaceae bacterium 44XB]